MIIQFDFRYKIYSYTAWENAWLDGAAYCIGRNADNDTWYLRIMFSICATGIDWCCLKRYL